MAMTDEQVDDMCRKLAIAFGVAITDDLVKEMVNRFLCWKLPRDFHPDSGISFDPEYNVDYMAKQGLPPSRHEPQGTNLFHAGQAEEMIRHILGMHKRRHTMSTETEIQAKGLIATHITQGDLERNIVSEHYFTGADGVLGAQADHEPLVVPVGLGLLTFCVLVLRNGFTVTGESACVSPENFDVGIGRKIARENALQKIWPLMGYELKERMMAKG